LEITAVGWNVLQFEVFEDGTKSSPFGPLSRAIWSALRTVRVARSTLKYDIEKSREN
jgi:hypothetical protein